MKLICLSEEFEDELYEYDPDRHEGDDDEEDYDERFEYDEEEQP